MIVDAPVAAVEQMGQHRQDAFCVSRGVQLRRLLNRLWQGPDRCCRRPARMAGPGSGSCGRHAPFRLLPAERAIKDDPLSGGDLKHQRLKRAIAGDGDPIIWKPRGDQQQTCSHGGTIACRMDKNLVAEVDEGGRSSAMTRGSIDHAPLELSCSETLQKRLSGLDLRVPPS